MALRASVKLPHFILFFVLLFSLFVFSFYLHQCHLLNKCKNAATHSVLQKYHFLANEEPILKPMPRTCTIW